MTCILNDPEVLREIAEIYGISEFLALGVLGLKLLLRFLRPQGDTVTLSAARMRTAMRRLCGDEVVDIRPVMRAIKLFLRYRGVYKPPGLPRDAFPLRDLIYALTPPRAQ